MLKKILITGFEAFDSDATNPSAQCLEWLQTRFHSDSQIKFILLPVSFENSFLKFKKTFDEFSPDVVLLMGLAKNRTDLTVERIGINWVDARIPDNDGVTLVRQKISEEGPDGIFTRISFDKLNDQCNEVGVPLKISTSAGEYVCNDLLYKSLLYTQKQKTELTFFHLPGRKNLEEYQSIFLAIENIVKGVMIK